MQSHLIQHTTRSFIRAFICAAISLLWWRHGTGPEYTPDRGIQPAGFFGVNDLENINSVNWNMMFHLPVGSLSYGRGNSPGRKVRLLYNSKVLGGKTQF